MHSIPLAAFAAALTFSACHSPRSESEHAMLDTFDAQVAHGQTMFAKHCATCHGDSGQGDKGPRLVGLQDGALPLDPRPGAKVRKTRFVTAGDVADFVVKNMPGKAPGSLPLEDYLAILAFDLKLNGIYTGPDKLTVEKAHSLVIPR